MEDASNLFKDIAGCQYVERNPLFIRRRTAGYRDLVQRLNVAKKLAVHNGCVNTVSWNDSGRYVLSGSDDQHLVITDPFSGKVVVDLYSPHRANIFSAKFLPQTNDRKIISCSGDGMIYFTDLDQVLADPLNSFDCHFGTVYKVVTAPQDPNSFLSCGEDGTVRWFDLRIKQRCQQEDCREDVLINCRRAVTALAVNPAVPYQLAVGCSDSSVRVYDRRMLGTKATGSSASKGLTGLITRFSAPQLEDKMHRITSLCYNRSGSELLVSYSSESVYLYNTMITAGVRKLEINPPKAPQENNVCVSEPPPESVNPQPSTSDTKEMSVDEGACAADTSTDKMTPAGKQPPVKRLRLRGDWSDTGPNARPEHERTQEDRVAVNIMQRMSDMLTRWLEVNRQDENQAQADNTASQEGSQASVDNSNSNSTARMTEDEAVNMPETSRHNTDGQSPSDNSSAVETDCCVKTEDPSVTQTECKTSVSEETVQEDSSEGEVDQLMRQPGESSEPVQAEAVSCSDATIKTECASSEHDSFGFSSSDDDDDDVEPPVDRQALAQIRQNIIDFREKKMQAGISGIVSMQFSSKARSSVTETSLVREEDETHSDRPQHDVNSSSATESPAERLPSSEEALSHACTSEVPQESAESAGDAMITETVSSCDVSAAASAGTESTEQTQQSLSGAAPQAETSSPEITALSNNESSVTMDVDESNPSLQTPSTSQSGLQYSEEYRRQEASPAAASNRTRRVGHSGPPTGDFQLNSDQDSSDDDDVRPNRGGQRRNSGPRVDRPWRSENTFQRQTAAIRLQQLYRKRQDERQREEERMLNLPQPTLCHKYQGHRNARTMIKEAAFWGDRHVMSGSDCGHVFIWDVDTEELVMLLEADRHVVNCIQPHPTDPILATSGIDYDIKIWTPGLTQPTFDSVRANEICMRNRAMLEETKDTITVPASFMLRMLASLNHFRSAQRRGNTADNGSDESSDR